MNIFIILANSFIILYQFQILTNLSCRNFGWQSPVESNWIMIMWGRDKYSLSHQPSVTYPVIFAYIDENINIPFQKSCDVVLHRVIFVQVVCKVDWNPTRARKNVASNWLVDSKLSTNIRTIEVSQDVSDRTVAISILKFDDFKSQLHLRHHQEMNFMTS